VTAPSAVTAPHRAMLPTVLAAPLLSAMDAFIVTLAIPALETDLDASTATIQLIIAGYAMTYGVGMVTGGRLGDLYGRRRVFASAIALFTAASLACGLAPTAGVLLGARVVQGAAAAMMVPQVLAIFSTVYEGEARARAINWYGFTLGVGAVLGQVVSGLLIGADVFGLGWRACFLVNLPVGIAAVVLTLRVVPESRAPGRPRLDPLGVLLVTFALLAVVVPLTVGREQGWPVWTWACFASAVPLFAVFGVHQHRLRTSGGSPLVDLTLFRERAFSAGLACQLVFWTGQGAFYLALGLYAQFGWGLRPFTTGLLFVVVNLGFMSTSLNAHRVARRLGRQVIALGGLLRIVGLLGQIAVVTSVGADGAVGWIVPWLFVDGAGMGLAVAPLASTVLARVRPDHIGSASGVLTTGVQVGSALGVALIGVIFYAALDSGGDYSLAYGLSLLYPIGVGLVLALLVQLLPKGPTS
jgi:EmrB/QacA subfamily drug resistance transporter